MTRRWIDDNPNIIKHSQFINACNWELIIADVFFPAMTMNVTPA